MNWTQFQEACELIPEKMGEVVRAEKPDRHTLPRTHGWASMIRPCVRAMALDMTHPEDSPEWVGDRLWNMERGNKREGEIRRRLEQAGELMGFEVTETQRYVEIKDRDNLLLCTAKIDGRLYFSRAVQPVMEIKTGSSFSNLERVEDFDKNPYTQGKDKQLLLYLYSFSEPFGCWIIESPRGGLPRVLPVRLEDHLDRAEQALQSQRQAVEHALGVAELPPEIKDKTYCLQACDHYNKSCVPEGVPESKFGFTEEPALVDAAAIVADHDQHRKDCDKARKRLATAFRGYDRALIGNFLLEGKTARAAEGKTGRYTFDVRRVAKDEVVTAADAAEKPTD